MEDKYFDDKLKNILNSPPEFEVDEAAIVNMQSKLRDAQPSSNNNRRSGFAIPLLLGLLLLGAGYGFYKIEKLSSELSAFMNEEKSLTLKKDTVFEKHIVYQYDTIYNVIYKEKYIMTEKPIENTSLVFDPRFLERTQNKHKNNFTISKMNLGWSPEGSGYSLLNKIPGSRTFEKGYLNAIKSREVDYLSLLKLNQLPIDIKPELTNKLREEDYEPRERKINPLLYLLPEGAQAKVNYAPYVFLQNEYGGDAKIYGINSEIELPKNRSLTIGVEYLNGGFVFSDLDNLPSIPVAPPNNPGDELAEVKASMKCIQIPLGIRQNLMPKSLINPTISAGVVAAIPVQQKYTYEYFDGGEEYYLDAEGNNSRTTFDNLRLGLGAEYNVWKNFSLESEILYQHGFSKDETALFEMRYWAFQFGIKYKL